MYGSKLLDDCLDTGERKDVQKQYAAGCKIPSIRSLRDVVRAMIWLLISKVQYVSDGLQRYQ